MDRPSNGIRAVFFDSGGTLARPTGGRWWPKPRFRELISAAGLAVPDDDRVRAALDAGEPHLSAHRVLASVEAELAMYAGYYAIVLGVLYRQIPAGLARSLAEAAVFDLDQQPYTDTVPTLDRLAAAGAILGVVSNAGPSLDIRHRQMGLREYFDPFVVSTVVGSEKPDPRIYQLALDRAPKVGRLAPEEVVFVDDVPENVRSAVDLGMTGVLIDRAGNGDGVTNGDTDLATITGLTALVGLLDPDHPEGNGRR